MRLGTLRAYVGSSLARTWAGGLVFFWVFAACTAFALDAGTQKLEAAGLVEPTRSAPSIVLDIRYATANNFTGQPVYPSARCFLRAH